MPAPKKPQSVPFKSINFDGKYQDFSDFYETHKKEIYGSILELFKEFKITKKRTLSVSFSALIQGLEWSTEFKFNKKDVKVLKRDLIPIFEEYEDYETCEEINQLYKELTLSK
jgi:hypothetical protein